MPDETATDPPDKRYQAGMSEELDGILARHPTERAAVIPLKRSRGRRD